MGSGTHRRLASEYYAEVEKILSDPNYKQWLDEGRIDPVAHNMGSYKTEYDVLIKAQNQINTLKEQDKQLNSFYKLATGQDITPEARAKLVSYAYDPALLQAAVGQYAAKAPATGDYGESINAAIKEKLGRDATEAEKQYFGKQMEQGGVDLYGLNTFLEGTTEYQTKASDTARGKLATELGDVDQSYLDRVSKQLQAQYTAQGRQGAGAFGSALIGAGKDIATQRTGYLSQLGYGDFQRGQQNLRSDYEAQLARQYAGQQQGAALGQESRARYYGQQDFDRQQAAQAQMMRLQQSMQPKQGNMFQQMLPGLIQSAATLGGAYLGNPALGAAAGQAINSQNKSNVNSSYYYQQPRSNYVMR